MQSSMVLPSGIERGAGSGCLRTWLGTVLLLCASDAARVVAVALPAVAAVCTATGNARQRRAHRVRKPHVRSPRVRG